MKLPGKRKSANLFPETVTASIEEVNQRFQKAEEYLENTKKRKKNSLERKLLESKNKKIVSFVKKCCFSITNILSILNDDILFILINRLNEFICTHQENVSNLNYVPIKSWLGIFFASLTKVEQCRFLCKIKDNLTQILVNSNYSFSLRIAESMTQLHHLHQRLISIHLRQTLPFWIMNLFCVKSITISISMKKEFLNDLRTTPPPLPCQYQIYDIPLKFIRFWDCKNLILYKELPFCQWGLEGRKFLYSQQDRIEQKNFTHIMIPIEYFKTRICPSVEVKLDMEKVFHNQILFDKVFRDLPSSLRESIYKQFNTTLTPTLKNEQKHELYEFYTIDVHSQHHLAQIIKKKSIISKKSKSM